MFGTLRKTLVKHGVYSFVVKIALGYRTERRRITDSKTNMLMSVKVNALTIFYWLS